MRCLGIDFGAKRLGLSYGDELGVATPLPAVRESEFSRQVEAIAAVARLRKVTDLVVGHPLNMDGTVGPKAKEAERFAADLGTRLGMKVHLVDERLTSYEAEETIPKKDRRNVRATGVIDSRAATILLQDFLDQHFPVE